MSKLNLFFLIFIFSCFSSFAAIRSGSCPQEFVGRLKLKMEGGLNQNNYEIIQYIFINLETLRGEIADEVVVELLKLGPFKIEENKDYKIQLRNGKICWIQEYK